MRWDNLFDDLEGQLEHELGAEDVDLRAEEERLRLGRISIRDRLVSIAGAQSNGSAYAIRVQLRSGEAIAVQPTTFGKDWLAADLREESHRASQCILPLAAISGLTMTAQQLVESLETESTPEPASRPADRIGLVFVLRDLCRRRTGIELHSESGIFHGTIDRVGRDHFDLAVHEPGSARRETNVTQYRTVPLTAVLLIRL